MKLQLNKSILILAILAFTSCNTDKDDYETIPSSIELENRLIELYGSTDALKLPESTDFINIPNDPNNLITQEKVNLGKLLYHETGLSTNSVRENGRGTYSCASCHHVAAGFQSGMKQAIGEGGIGFGIAGEGRIASLDYLSEELDVQPIRTPSVLNVAYQEVMLWNGQFGATGSNIGTESSWDVGTPKETNLLGFQGVETQAIAGLSVHRMECDPNYLGPLGYAELFDEAFPDVPMEDRYTMVNAGLAIAAYERTLLPNEAPFQKWLKGEANAMSKKEYRGALLFYNKAQCYQCHSGPGMNGMEFYALGMKDLEGPDVHNNVDDATKRGRGGFTGNSDDNYKFKTPQLYNLKDVGFYGHCASFTSIR